MGASEIVSHNLIEVRRTSNIMMHNKHLFIHCICKKSFAGVATNAPRGRKYRLRNGNTNNASLAKTYVKTAPPQQID